MTLSMHAASAPVFERMLSNLGTWLVKAEAHDHARSQPEGPVDYMSMRLAPDMLPFAAQVRIASDIARLGAARLAGIDPPRWPDDETTLAALGARVRRSTAFIAALDAAQLEGSDAREIELPQRVGEPLRFSGINFLQRWALPNFHFHVTMAYALLRHAGVDLGKADYLGRD
jgi:hypothetical protein